MRSPRRMWLLHDCSHPRRARVRSIARPRPGAEHPLARCTMRPAAAHATLAPPERPDARASRATRRAFRQRTRDGERRFGRPSERCPPVVLRRARSLRRSCSSRSCSPPRGSLRVGERTTPPPWRRRRVTAGVMLQARTDLAARAVLVRRHRRRCRPLLRKGHARSDSPARATRISCARSRIAREARAAAAGVTKTAKRAGCARRRRSGTRASRGSEGAACPRHRR